jgi:hypothetical protein
VSNQHEHNITEVSDIRSMTIDDPPTQAVD